MLSSVADDGVVLVGLAVGHAALGDAQAARLGQRDGLAHVADRARRDRTITGVRYCSARLKASTVSV